MRHSGPPANPAEGASSRLNRVLLRAILLPVLLLAVLAAGLMWQINDLLARYQQVRRSDQTISRAHQVYRLLVDQETGMRGYLLTSAPGFLEPYRAAGSALPASLTGLRSLVSDSPEQVRRVDQVLVEQRKWHRFAEQSIAIAGRGSDPRSLVRTGQGKRATDRMRSALHALIQAEENLRHTQIEAVDQMVHHVLFTSGVLTVFLGVLLAFTSTRELTGVSRTYEQSLREREESGSRLAGIIGSAMDAIISVDAAQRIQVFNSAAEQMFARTSAEAVGAPLDVLLPERFRVAHHLHVEEFGRGGVKSRKMGMAVELRALRADGAEFPIEATISQVEVQGQKLYTAVVRDLTEREAADRALRETQALFREFMDHTPALAFIRDAEGRLIYVNTAYESFFGTSLADLTGSTVEQLVPEDTAHRLRVLYERVRADNRPLQEFISIPTPAGEEHDFQFYLFPITNAAGERVLGGLALDISAQRALEGQLRQSQKMEAIGRLAGGVAHDFNNMLAVILGYSELILNRLSPSEPVAHLLLEIKSAGERATSLTRQLLAFSRQQIVEARLLDLNQVIASMRGMLQRLIGEDVELVTVPASNPTLVMADPGHIEQVLLNLAVNARDAMPQGGKLTIEVREVELDENYAREHAEVTPGPHVLLAVSDTGSGMDAATRARIFEPFFTPKGLGEGTGLGLATVFGIVKQHQGSVWVYSEPGQGTTFKLYFPKVSAGEAADDRSLHSPEVLLGRETVLLLEDDALVRGMVSAALTESGYQVVVAESSGDALRLCREQGHSIDILLTDVVMPQMSGREVAEQARVQCPAIKVLFMSGYTDDAVVRHGVLHAEEHFIQKPFALADLTRKMREVLDA